MNHTNNVIPSAAKDLSYGLKDPSGFALGMTRGELK
jgi:hypothetical protein